MLIELVIAAFIGLICGILTGLTPGLHVNTIAALVISASPFFVTHYPPMLIALAILAMGLTHTFLDVIPATFLGIPDTANALLVLPAHTLVLEGKGYRAVRSALNGSFISLLVCLMSAPAILFILETIIKRIQPFIPYCLIGIIMIIILKQPTIAAKVRTFTFFLISGTLGLITFASTQVTEPLLPLLSGFFGASGVLISIQEQKELPFQYRLEHPKLPKPTIVSQSLKAWMGGGVTGILPGLSSSQAALVNEIRPVHWIKRLLHKKPTKKRIEPSDQATAYIFLLGGINTTNFVFSILAIYAIGKARNGAIIAVTKVLPTVSTLVFLICIAMLLVIGSVAFILGEQLIPLFVGLTTKLPYMHINIGLLVFLTCMVLLLTGAIGMAIFLTSTALGVLCFRYSVPKTALMGCILIPVILYLI
jgi:putative membrane protein